MGLLLLNGRRICRQYDGHFRHADESVPQAELDIFHNSDGREQFAPLCWCQLCEVQTTVVLRNKFEYGPRPESRPVEHSDSSLHGHFLSFEISKAAATGWAIGPQMKLFDDFDENFNGRKPQDSHREFGFDFP